MTKMMSDAAASSREFSIATLTSIQKTPSRRAILLGSSVVSLTLLSACATGADSDAVPSAGSGSSSAKTQRIASLDPFSTYNLFDLGMVPVTAQEGLEAAMNPRYTEKYSAVPSSGTWDEPDLEAIAASNPDLILMSDAQSDFKAQLEEIAEVVVITSATSDTWPTAAQEVADAVGRGEDLKRLREDYEAKAAKVREDYGDVLKRYRWATVWLGTDNGFSLRSQQSNGGIVLSEAGIRFSDSTEKLTDPQDLNVSWEETSKLDDADVICLPGLPSGAENPQTKAIVENSMFTRLPAAKAERVFVFDFLTPGSYGSASSLLDELRESLDSLSK